MAFSATLSPELVCISHSQPSIPGSIPAPWSSNQVRPDVLLKKPNDIGIFTANSRFPAIPIEDALNSARFAAPANAACPSANRTGA